jgi:hypothetical protein
MSAVLNAVRSVRVTKRPLPRSLTDRHVPFSPSAAILPVATSVSCGCHLLAGALPISSNAAPPIIQFIRTMFVSLADTIARGCPCGLEQD